MKLLILLLPIQVYCQEIFSVTPYLKNDSIYSLLVISRFDINTEAIDFVICQKDTIFNINSSKYNYQDKHKNDLFIHHKHVGSKNLYSFLISIVSDNNTDLIQIDTYPLCSKRQIKSFLRRNYFPALTAFP